MRSRPLAPTVEDMTITLEDPTLDPAQDPAINRRTRSFLEEVNKDSSPFWELPGDVPRKIITSLQDRTPVDLSGITVDERELTVDGRSIALYVVRPEGATGTLPVFMFFHGAVWIAGNFENHKRLVRDLVVGSQAVAVFPTPGSPRTTTTRLSPARTASNMASSARSCASRPLRVITGV
jgi:acetyl esterase